MLPKLSKVPLVAAQIGFCVGSAGGIWVMIGLTVAPVDKPTKSEAPSTFDNLSSDEKIYVALASNRHDLLSGPIPLNLWLLPEFMRAGLVELGRPRDGRSRGEGGIFNNNAITIGASGIFFS